MNNEKGMIEIESSGLDFVDLSQFCQIVRNENAFLRTTTRTIDIEASDFTESYQQIEEKPSNIVITIPAFNEEKTIKEVISTICKIMDNTKYKDKYLVLVVDDGSSDNTAIEASEAGAYVYSHKVNQGLAQTFRTEMKLCIELAADIIVHTDADGQYKAEEIPILIREIEKGNDLVLGSRFLGTIEQMPRMKRFGNKAFSFVLSMFSRRRISDWQTGFRAFSIKVAKEIEIISTHTYTQEQIIRANKKNFKIVEVPIYFARRNDGQSRLMKSPLDYAIKAWINIFRIYLN